MDLPTHALDPSGNLVTLLVTPDGKLVTDLNPKPPTTVPIYKVSLVTDVDGNLRVA